MSHRPCCAASIARGRGQRRAQPPEVGNAYNGDMIGALLTAMASLAGAPGLRAVLLRGNGRHFQAGADLKWVSAVAGGTADENVASAAPRPTPSTASIGCPSRPSPWCRAAASAAAPASLPPAIS